MRVLLLENRTRENIGRTQKTKFLEFGFKELLRDTEISSKKSVRGFVFVYVYFYGVFYYFLNCDVGAIWYNLTHGSNYYSRQEEEILLDSTLSFQLVPWQKPRSGETVEESFFFVKFFLLRH